MHPQERQAKRNADQCEQPTLAGRRDDKGSDAAHLGDVRRYRHRAGHLGIKAQQTIRTRDTEHASRAIWQLQRHLDSLRGYLPGPSRLLIAGCEFSQLRRAHHHLLANRSWFRIDVQLLERDQTSQGNGCRHIG